MRRLEEALGEAELAKAASSDEVTLTGRVRTGAVADVPSLKTASGTKPEELCIAVRAAEVEDGELFAVGSPWRFAVTPDPPPAGASSGKKAAARLSRAGVLVGDCADPGEVVEACGERAVVAHDAKALGVVPPGLAHDTLLGAYLLEPARRGYPFAELCEERGLVAEVEDPLAGEALLLSALAAWQREQIVERGLQGVMCDIELPLVAVLREMELLGVRLNVERLQEITKRVREEIAALEQRIYELAEEEFTIGSPQQLGEILFVKLGLSRKRRGKTGFSTDARVLQAIREEHEIVPHVERWRELSTLIKTYLDVLPEQVDDALAHPHHVSAGGRADGTPGLHQPEHAERPDPHAPGSRDPGLLRGRAGQPLDLGRLLPDRAARARAHRRGAGPGRDLQARRGRAHGNRLRRCSRWPPRRSTRVCARRRR